MGNCGCKPKSRKPIPGENGGGELVTQDNDVPRYGKDPTENSPHQRSELPRSLPPPPSIPLQVKKVNTFVALLDYDARTSEDLTFRKGDFLEVDQDFDFSQDWWFAESQTSKLQGYIPSNFVGKADSLSIYPWYFAEISSHEAERRLHNPANYTSGSYLIRDLNQGQKYQYALALRDGDTVEHYRIHEGGYYISKHRVFADLPQLLEHYKVESDGLVCTLKIPCVQTEQPQTVGLSYKDEMEIPRDQLKFIKKLGGGQFGEVWEGLWNSTTSVAIKTLKEGTVKQEEFLDEANVMKKLIHPRLVQLYAVCSIGEPILIITELLPGVALLEYLRNDAGRRLRQKYLMEISAQVADGMAHIELMGYIHRDLAARNILVAENRTVKVADFGLARVIQDDVYEVRNRAKVHIKWMAPEAINLGALNIKSDVWSFGVLLSEIITYGRIPYPGMNNYEVFESVRRGFRMPKPNECPNRLYGIMMQCWQADPECRPTFETLKWQLEEFYHREYTGDFRTDNEIN